MPILKSPQQEKFAQLVANSKTHYEAYLEAYPTSVKWNRQTVDKRASELYSDREILGRINELKEEIKNKVIKGFVKTKIDILNELEIIKDNNTDSKIKIDCIKEQGKLLGYYVDLKKELKPSEFKDWLKSRK